METQPASVYFQRRPEEDFFRKRHTATVAFALALLLFLMPFAELTCGRMTLMGNTGIGIALGTEWKVAMGGNKLFDKMGDKASDTVDQTNARKALSSGVNVFLLIALAAGAIGIASVFFTGHWKHLIGLCAALLACVMLIAVMIQFRILMKSALSEGAAKSKMDADMSGLIRIKFTIWYYCCFVSFAAAAFFKYKHYRFDMDDAMNGAVDFEFQKQKIDPPATGSV